MQVFKINRQLFNVPLTVDSTLYTVDSTLITVDTTIEGSYPYRIKTVPRFHTQDFTITLKNELKQTTETLTIDYWRYDGEYLCAYFDYPFIEGDAFEIKIVDNPTNEIAKREKGYATAQEDLENFKMNLPNQDNKIRMR